MSTTNIDKKMLKYYRQLVRYGDYLADYDVAIGDHVKIGEIACYEAAKNGWHETFRYFFPAVNTSTLLQRTIRIAKQHRQDGIVQIIFDNHFSLFERSCERNTGRSVSLICGFLDSGYTSHAAALMSEKSRLLNISIQQMAAIIGIVYCKQQHEMLPYLHWPSESFDERIWRNALNDNKVFESMIAWGNIDAIRLYLNTFGSKSRIASSKIIGVYSMIQAISHCHANVFEFMWEYTNESMLISSSDALSKKEKKEMFTSLAKEAIVRGKIDTLKVIERLFSLQAHRVFDILSSFVAKAFSYASETDLHTAINYFYEVGLSRRDIYTLGNMQSCVKRDLVSLLDDMYENVTISSMDAEEMQKQIMEKLSNCTDQRTFDYFASKIDVGEYIRGGYLKKGGFDMRILRWDERIPRFIADNQEYWIAISSVEVLTFLLPYIEKEEEGTREKICPETLTQAIVVSRWPESPEMLELLLNRGYKLRYNDRIADAFGCIGSSVGGKKLKIAYQHGFDIKLFVDEIELNRHTYIDWNIPGADYWETVCLSGSPKRKQKILHMCLKGPKNSAGNLRAIMSMLSLGAQPAIVDADTLKHCRSMVVKLIQHGAVFSNITSAHRKIYNLYRREIQAQRVLRRNIFRLVKEYVYSPWGRHATEELELMKMHEEHEKGEREVASAQTLRERRNLLVEELLALDYEQRILLARSLPREIDLPDGSGKRLISEAIDTPLNIRQHLYRLPTTLLLTLLGKK